MHIIWKLQNEFALRSDHFRAIQDHETTHYLQAELFGPSALMFPALKLLVFAEAGLQMMVRACRAIWSLRTRSSTSCSPAPQSHLSYSFYFPFSPSIKIAPGPTQLLFFQLRRGRTLLTSLMFWMKCSTEKKKVYITKKDK